MPLKVAGNTDSQGRPAYNQWLSLQSAQAVRDYLVALVDCSSTQRRINKRLSMRSLRHCYCFFVATVCAVKSGAAVPKAVGKPDTVASSDNMTVSSPSVPVSIS